MPGMNAPVLTDQGARTTPATARPYLLGGLASLSVGAAAIHFAVIFEHFAEYALYGVFFLVLSWAQLVWAAVVLWRPSRLWLWLGAAGNALVVVVYVASRTTGLPIGPDVGNPEPAGGLDVVGVVLELALIAGCVALLWRPSLADRPVGGSLTRWHSHLVVCRGGKPAVAGFGVQLRGFCDPGTWRNRYTAQMLHVWVVPYSGGPFSDDLSTAATDAAVRAVLGQK